MENKQPQPAKTANPQLVELELIPKINRTLFNIIYIGIFGLILIALILIILCFVAFTENDKYFISVFTIAITITITSITLIIATIISSFRGTKMILGLLKT